MRKSVVRLAAALAACCVFAIGAVSMAAGSSSPAKPAVKAKHVKAKHVKARHLNVQPARARHVAAPGRPLAAKEDPPRTSESEPAGEPESAADTAAQAAACQNAGLDPNAGNIQFDDQSGTCSIDNGNSGG